MHGKNGFFTPTAKVEEKNVKSFTTETEGKTWRDQPRKERAHLPVHVSRIFLRRDRIIVRVRLLINGNRSFSS
jgi:hypothetical protein